MANWLASDVPEVRGGFRIGLATWAELRPEAVAELARWLQFVPADEADGKYVFGRLQTGQLFWARLAYLPGRDDVGRDTVRFWGHALVADTIPAEHRGHSPLAWWGHLPFFTDFEAAKAARTDGTNLSGLAWRPPLLPPVRRSGDARLAVVVRSAFRRLGGQGTAIPITLARDDAAGWQDAEDAYRLLDPTEWAALPADSGFDGVIPEPERRYWVVGTMAPQPAESAAPDGAAEAAELGRAQQWAVELTESGRWAAAVADMAAVERTVAWLRAGSPELAAIAGGIERSIVARFGSRVIVDEVGELLKHCGCPVQLLELICLGLLHVDRTDLLDSWLLAHSIDDTVHLDQLILAGLLSFPDPAHAAVDVTSTWQGRGRFPIIGAWLIVVAHGISGRHPVAGRAKRPDHLDEALWELPADMLGRWARFVFGYWPGAPAELVLPVADARDHRAWASRAHVVAQVAYQTWAKWAAADPALDKAARQWVRSLAQASGGDDSPVARWFEDKVYGQKPPQRRLRARWRGGSR